MFSVLQLRSMRPAAEAESGPVWTCAQDERITRVGKYLRMTRLDELTTERFGELNSERTHAS